MTLEQIYREAEKLVEEAGILKEALHRHNPGIEGNDKTPLITLAMDAGKLGRLFNTLGVDIIKEHEKRQRNETNSNG